MTTIKAQIPGVFYRRPSPEEPAYADIGDSISEGQTIALVEVMKTFNEIKADASGVIDSFLVDNEDEVEAGQDIVQLKDT